MYVTRESLRALGAEAQRIGTGFTRMWAEEVSMDERQNESLEQAEPYEVPAVTDYGTLQALTLGSGSAPLSDNFGASGAGGGS